MYSYVFRQTHRYNSKYNNYRHTQTPPPKLCIPWAAAAGDVQGPGPLSRLNGADGLTASAGPGSAWAAAATLPAPPQPLWHPLTHREGDRGPPALRLPALTCFTQGCSPGPAPVPAAAPAPCQQVKMVRRNAEPLFLKIYEETQAYN